MPMYFFMGQNELHSERKDFGICDDTLADSFKFKYEIMTLISFCSNSEDIVAKLTKRELLSSKYQS